MAEGGELEVISSVSAPKEEFDLVLAEVERELSELRLLQQERKELIDKRREEVRLKQEEDRELEMLRFQLAYLMAQKNIAKEQNDEILSTPFVDKEKLIQRLRKDQVNINKILSQVEKEKESLLQEKGELEVKLQKEKLVAEGLRVKLEEQRREAGHPSSADEVKEAIRQVEENTKQTMDFMKKFLRKYHPLPSEEVLRVHARRGQDLAQVLSLEQLLMELIQKHEATPHDPWIILDERIWPPHVELLINSTIAETHPQNSNMMRLVMSDD